MKNKKSNALRFVLRLICVALTALFCLMLGTASYPQSDFSSSTAGHSQAAASTTPELNFETPSPTPEPTPEPQPEYFTLNFVGDCTLASTVYNKPISVSYESVVGENHAFPFEKTASFFSDDDFTFANLECVLSGSTEENTKNFCFRADPSYVNILKSGSVEFVSLGNNHVLDYGEAGYAETKAVLDIAGISYAGRNEWKIYETASGLKIGVYSASFEKTDKIKAGVAAVKAEGAEFVVASLHWGDEGSYDVNKLQREQAHAAIDAGADMVYGSHPHVLQECEEYNGKYIYYSLGNWTFGGNTAPRDPDTIILKVTVMRDVDGTVSVASREHIPCSITGIPGGNNYQPYPYEVGSEAYNRTFSKIDGTFDGANLSINYEYTFSEY